MTKGSDVTARGRPCILVVSGNLGITAVALLIAASLAGCSGDVPGGPHRTSLPHAIGGYRLGFRWTGSQGTIFYTDRRFTGLKQGSYFQKGNIPRRPSLDLDSILVDTGRVSKIAPGRALASIYGRFKAMGQVGGGQSPFGTMRSVPAGSLGGQASCWRVGATVNGSAARDGAMCMWADNDTFGLLLTPVMNPSRLAVTMLSFRAAIEKSADR